MSDLDIIKQIEKELAVKLNILGRLNIISQSYTLNQNGHVTSLAFYFCEIKNLNRIISPLKKLKQLTNLELFGNSISNVSSLKDLSQLTTLGLGNNNIRDISMLKNLNQLKELDLGKNPIKDWSPLKHFGQLKTLKLYGNRISDYSFLKELRQLLRLHLNGNQICDISFLKDLTQIKKLDLRNNQISNFSFLRGLPQLELLYLENNQISDISFLSDLPQLKWIDLNNNQISDISFLRDLHQLESLYLDNNQISDILPLKDLKKLKTLKLSKNPIEDLHSWITDFNLDIKWDEYGYGNRNGIFFYDNPLKVPPPEIVKQGNDAISNYFEQLIEQKEDYLFEAKMLIVGEPGAGKTSMAWKMEDADCRLPKEKETTKGIDVKQYYFKLQKEDFPTFKHPEKLENRKFRLNLWDFGGQEIYKATHRFFLSKRSLYSLVADSRNEDTDFNYWLHIIEMFGSNSPLLIVLNEKHQRKRNIDIDAMRNRFSNISEVLDIDFAEQDKTRLNKLQRAVKYYVSQLPLVGSPVPAKWTVVREALEKDQHNTITLQDYLTICKNNDITKPKDALVLSQYFHDIGVFLHFQDDDLLKKTVFLKPTWATQAVYKILDHELLNKNNGRFSREEANTIWWEDEYEFIRGELLRLMKKFFLTYEIENSGKYIVPERLPRVQPEYAWDEKDNLFLRYQYDIFMPRGIMSQFTVQMHPYIIDHGQVWMRGVVLNRENTAAEIIETYDARKIKIRVSGKNRRDFMTIITEQFDRINSQFEKMKVDKMIPCNCQICKANDEPYFFEYTKLQRRLDNNINAIECETSFKKVNIRSLIDEVIIEEKIFPEENKMIKRDKVFVSYSHKDKEWLERVQTHLDVLESEGISVNLWDDSQIKAGMKWREEIERELQAAKVAILLVSTDFLASDFILKNELPPLLQAAKNDGATILPLIIKPCRYSTSKLSEFQSVNDPEKEPLIKLTEDTQEEILIKLADRIAELIEP